jgi:hypothetical protein
MYLTPLPTAVVEELVWLIHPDIIDSRQYIQEDFLDFQTQTHTQKKPSSVGTEEERNPSAPPCPLGHILMGKATLATNQEALTYSEKLRHSIFYGNGLAHRFGVTQ